MATRNKMPTFTEREAGTEKKTTELYNVRLSSRLLYFLIRNKFFVSKGNLFDVYFTTL